MKNFTKIIAVAVALITVAIHAKADHLSSKFLFAARMNGGQEVPSVSTNALGLATFYLNDERDTLCFEMTATGLSGAITGIHIHEAAAGANGAVVLDMMPYLTGNRLKGTLTGAALTSSLIAKMFAGQFYLNVHTSANPNGEIRGQILPEEDKAMSVMLNGANEVPAVTTNATGLGFFMLQKHEGRLSFNIVTDGLSGPITGAHLHLNVAGQNGGVVEDLTSFISGNRISGSVITSASYINALKSDSLYINIHTAANPNGEIRGQLVMEPYLHFDAAMDTAQETTPVIGQGDEIGAATLKLNYTFDTLWYHAQVNGLTGSISAAHFHKGTVNNSGGVVVGIPSTDINGNIISGMITGTNLSDTFLHGLLDGSIYLNIHTTVNANGEIRGQVYRTFREGYTYHLNGAQEVPMVNSNASGTGMVSIDRDQTSAHYMMVMDNLTGFTAAHFHNNVAGQNGGVMYGIGGNYANDGIFGYWLSTDPNTAFTSAMSNKFRKDSVYVNIHTSANANGEIRGNVTRNLCNEISVGINDTKGTLNAVAHLYPNPAQEYAILDITLAENLDAEIQVTDVTGRTLWTVSKDLNKGVNRVHIPLNNTPAGMYFVRVVSASGQLSYRLIRE